MCHVIRVKEDESNQQNPDASQVDPVFHCNGLGKQNFQHVRDHALFLV